MAEKKAAETAEQSDASVAPATAPAAQPAVTSPRFDRGILIGAGAAALVVGLAVGGVSGFAIAQATSRPPIASGQGWQNLGGGGQGQLPGPGMRPPQGPGPHSGHGGTGPHDQGQQGQDEQGQQGDSGAQED